MMNNNHIGYRAPTLIRHYSVGLLVFSFWAILSLVCIFNIAILGVQVAASSAPVQSQYIPDDAYYYLTLARNFTHFGYWTFDGGQSVTSGFHPLLAYLLASIYALAKPSTDGFVRLAVLLTTLTTVVAASTAFAACWRSRNRYAMLVLALVLSARNFTYNAVSGMEWALVVLSAVLYLLIVSECLSGRITPRMTAILFLCGVFGSLSRSDFGLFPAMCLAAVVLVNLYMRRRVVITPYLAGLFGAVMGLALVLLGNYFFTGTFLQTSARIKAYWSQLTGFNYHEPVALLGRSLGFETGLLDWFLLGMFFLVIYLLLKRLRDRMKHRPVVMLSRYPRECTLMVAGILTALGYAVFDAHNGDVQPWYTSNIVVAVFLVATGGVAYMTALSGKRLYQILSVLTLIAVILNVASVYPVSAQTAPWPGQRVLYDAGQELTLHPPFGNIGAWNAGVVGYYTDLGIINLDGLMNDSVYPYVISNRLFEYVSVKQIRTIVDIAAMIDLLPYRLRGGYDDPNFMLVLRQRMAFGSPYLPDGEANWMRAVIYTVLSKAGTIP